MEAEERKVKTPDRAQKGNGEAATDGGGEVEVTLKMVYDSLRRLEELVRRLEGARLVVAGEVGGEDDEGGENWEDWDESQSVLTEFGKDSRIHLRGVRRLVEDVDAYEVITEEEEKEDAASEEDDPDWEEADLTTDKARRGYEGDEHGRDEVCAACGREYENEYADLEIEENGMQSSASDIESSNTEFIHSKENCRPVLTCYAIPQSSAGQGFSLARCARALTLTQRKKRKNPTNLAITRSGTPTTKPRPTVNTTSRALVFVPHVNQPPQAYPTKPAAPPHLSAAPHLTPLHSGYSIRTGMFLRPSKVRQFYGSKMKKKVDAMAENRTRKTQLVHRPLTRQDNYATGSDEVAMDTVESMSSGPFEYEV